MVSYAASAHFKKDHLPSDYTFFEHSHDFTEVVILLNGKGTQVVNGVPFAIEASDVFLIAGDQHHYFDSCHHLKCINVAYYPHLFQHELDDLRELPVYNALFLVEPTDRS